MRMLSREIYIFAHSFTKITFDSVLQILGKFLYLGCASDDVEICCGFSVLEPTLGSSGIEHEDPLCLSCKMYACNT
jgi:hypothetical protein